MTISLITVIPNGIILGTDSRQIRFMINQIPKIDSDNVRKIIRISNRIAVMCIGLGSIYIQKQSSPIVFGQIISRIKDNIDNQDTVYDVANKLRYELNNLKKKENISNGVIQNATTRFYLAGYSIGSIRGEVYRIEPQSEVMLVRDTNDPGAVWDGASSIIERIILGYDQFLFERIIEANKELESILQEQQMLINFQTMTIKDAIALTKTLIQTTIEVQNRSDGRICQPNEYPTCGGKVNIVVIQPGKPKIVNN